VEAAKVIKFKPAMIDHKQVNQYAIIEYYFSGK
jgi:hypothetical protein